MQKDSGQNSKIKKVSNTYSYKDEKVYSKEKKFSVFAVINKNIVSTQKPHAYIWGAPGTFRYFQLCSICVREGLGRSKPATNP